MLSEDFDKKIREAADHHHPAYDERAWRDMNKLLDKHMPEEDRKRRWIFFLLLFILLGTGLAGLVTGWWTGDRNSPPPVAVSGTQPERSETPQGKDQSPAATGTMRKEGAKDIPAPDQLMGSQPGTRAERNPQQESSPSGREIFREDQPVEISGSAARVQKRNNRNAPQDMTRNASSDPDRGTKTKNIAGSPVSGNDNAAVTRPETTSNKNPGAEKNSAPVPVSVETASKMPTEKDGKDLAAAQDPTVKAQLPAEQKEKKAASSKTKKGGRNIFFLAASAGPDVSYTKGDAPGRVKITGGLGIGYTFRDRLTLRTGFYSGRKIYTASAEQYHGNAAFYQYYPNLQKVDADCEVYEIPFALSYQFGAKGKRPFFVSAGLSSLIMKEETYTYFYKYNAAGPTVSRTHSTYNKNNHFLSIATLSAGYQQKIGKRFMLMAEPYVKLPVSGVGNGKVMLNSTGIQFSVGFTPFSKKSSAGTTH